MGIEQQVRSIGKEIRTSTNIARKADLLVEMGDMRFHHYKSTGDKRHRDLAGRCYLAARNLLYKN